MKEIAEQADKTRWCYNENKNLEQRDANDGLYGDVGGLEPSTFPQIKQKLMDLMKES